MPYDINTYWGADSKDVQTRGCLGCMTFVLCSLAIGVGLIALIVWLVRTIIG